MSKHTPGPWHWTPNYACAGEQKGASIYIEEGGTRCFLADVSARDVTLQAICEANARLIAAAPDMLEALEILVGQVKFELGHKAEVLTDIKLARAAIARARVES